MTLFWSDLNDFTKRDKSTAGTNTEAEP